MNKNKCNGEFGCTYSKTINQEYPRKCIKCGHPEIVQDVRTETWVDHFSRHQSFLCDQFPEVIHVIKTGWNDTYLLIRENPYGIKMSNLEIVSKSQIEKMFNVKLKI